MTDQELFGEIQDTLLEPNDLGLTYPSGLWTRDEVVGALRDSQNRLLKETQLLIGFVAIDVNPAETRLALPEDWLITWNVVWTGANGIVRELVRADSFEAVHAHPSGGITQATPQVYFDNDQPLLQIQIFPPPDVAGSLEVLYVPEGTEVGGLLAEPMITPDEWCSTVKYGALADLFGKDGRGKSPDRARYCDSRFTLGVELAKLVIRSSWVGP